jgi:hypothetical protein
MIPTALHRPAPHDRTGAGTIVVTLPLAYAKRWRLVLENASTSTGSITAVSWRRSAVGTAYGPAASQTVSAPVAPGASWGASDDGDCVDQLEVTVTVDGDATINVSLAGV